MNTDFLHPLRQIAGLSVDFVERIPDLPMDVDRDEAMLRSRHHHAQRVNDLGFSLEDWWRAEQVHGNRVAVVEDATTIMATDGLPLIAGVDGLITQQAPCCLAIYVADCGAIWLADTHNGAIGLLHSGKKGTEGNILGVAVDLMQERFQSKPENIVAVLGPCIRPPHYEIDFAAEIGRQAQAAGLKEFHDSHICTASDLSNYYSYRKELGRTGRMMALIGKLS